MNRDHVLVTVYRDPLGARPPVTHAYGPMTKEQAERQRRRSLAENATEALRGHFHAYACKMIDIDAMNREAAAR